MHEADMKAHVNQLLQAMNQRNSGVEDVEIFEAHTAECAVAMQGLVAMAIARLADAVASLKGTP